MYRVNVDRIKIASQYMKRHGLPMENKVAPRGLKGLIVAETRIGEVRGEEGFFHYCGHDATVLARERSLESVWAMLLGCPEGDLLAKIQDSRKLPERLIAPLVAIGRAAPSLLLGLQSAVPLLAGANPTYGASAADVRARAIELASRLPSAVAVLNAARNRRSTPNVRPSGESLGFAEHYLRSVTERSPTAAQVRALETYLIATLDHGMNASTFTSRVVASTGASIGAALSAGVGALSGPLHGGAPSLALSMIEDIGDPANAKAWTLSKLRAGEKIMGFGHAVYRAGDPRSLLLREVALSLSDPLAARAVAIERGILSALTEFKPKARIVTNVEYFAGVVLHLCGLTPSLFTPTFAVSRALGWTAHVLEQAKLAQIIRPSAHYVGPKSKRSVACV